MAGCGGFCGGLDTGFPDGQFTNNLNWGLFRGYAAATTDSGHDNLGNGRTYGAWAEDNRRGEIDWGYRSIHEVTRVCKALSEFFTIGRSVMPTLPVAPPVAAWPSWKPPAFREILTA